MEYMNTELFTTNTKRMNVMKLLIATNKPGSGSGQVIDALSPLYNKVMINPSPYDYYSASRRHDVVLNMGFPYYMYPRACPGVWYCMEPQIYLMREKGVLKRTFSKSLYKIEKKRVNNLSACIVADVRNAKRFNEIYGRYPDIVPYGIDYDFWSATPPVIDDGIFTVCQIGHIQQFKNQIRSIEAFAEFRKETHSRDSRLCFIGDIRDQKYYELMHERAKELGVQFSHLSEVTRYELRDLYYPYIDCVLHPIKNQGGYLTPLESAAANRPVIVSLDCSCSDIIMYHELGIISYSERNYPMWIDYIKNYGYTPNREWIKKYRTWHNFLTRMQDVLMGVL